MSQPSAPSDVDSPVTDVSDIESSAAQNATTPPAESTTSLSAEPVAEEAVEPVGEGQPSEAPSAADAEALLVREGDVAADYLERLLDILDYDGDIDLDVESDRAVVAVVGGNLRGLIGAGGATLDSLQELTRLAVAQQTGVRTRLMLDVGGYRAQRRA
ncbi:MAG: protein jag, partial [Geodermatophilaceae bacterium]